MFAVSSKFLYLPISQNYSEKRQMAVYSRACHYKNTSSKFNFDCVVHTNLILDLFENSFLINLLQTSVQTQNDSGIYWKFAT